ncbi:MAG: ATP-binding protein [Meiothermus ruber]|uniref:ATP-binding protein n=1 Tax=Meiothermus ruber TaxID=277 RepID=UPI0012E05857|nr:ATP-binding protein [Meiothermus ruber]MCL6529764.1 ATP-binding protein [Meiothermus ruber]MCX7802535.1 ATP-binding protein [Meiothermus ruber]
MAGRQTFRILIVGKSGSGQSTLARSIIQQMQGRYWHPIIVNCKCAFSELAWSNYQGRYVLRLVRPAGLEPAT